MNSSLASKHIASDAGTLSDEPIAASKPFEGILYV